MDFVNKMSDQAKEAVETEAAKHQGQIPDSVQEAMGNMGIKTGGEPGQGPAAAAGAPAAVGGAGAHKKNAGNQGGGGKHGAGHGGGGGGGGGKHGTRAGPGAGKGAAADNDEFDDEVAGGIKADVRMFSGCDDHQTSADVHDVAKFGLPDAQGAGGACTNAVLVNVKDHKPDSWMSLLKGMRATLKQKKFAQIPQMATSKKLDIHSPFSLSGAEGGNRKALLIGINYKGCGAGELKGCHNDVASMKEYITEHGYPAEEGPNLKIVTDDGKHDAPTKANLLKALKWLVQGAKPGDSLFMHYSGHGGSVRDSTGDEEDQKDETMVPADYATSGQIKDDEILSTLVLPLPAGVTLTVVMDCCHSGSILDLPYSFDANDGALELVDAGGSGVVHKKKNFNMKKMKKAQQNKHKN